MTSVMMKYIVAVLNKIMSSCHEARLYLRDNEFYYDNLLDDFINYCVTPNSLFHTLRDWRLRLI